MTPERYLAGLAAHIVSDTLTAGEETELRYKLLDWAGCAIAGAACEKPRAASAAWGVSRGGECCVLGAGRADAAQAAFCNAFSASYLEFEDTHKEALCHPGGLNVAAALAACEREDCDLDGLLHAMAAGYEVTLRLGLAFGGNHYERWHNTGTCGPFGAAAAAGAAMGLEEVVLVRAFGIAANMSAGGRFAFGTDAKTAAPAHAALCGVLAARMARSGLTGPEDGLSKGLFPLMGDGETASRLTGTPEELRLWKDCAYKSYAACGHTHTALDCWRALREAVSFAPEDVERAEVDTFPVAVQATGALRCGDAVQARFSLPYCMAAQAVLGSLGPEAFTASARSDGRVLELARRIRVRADDGCAARYPTLRPARVTVFLRDGQVLTEYRERSVSRPSRSFLRAKFRALAGPVVGIETAAQLEALLLRGKRDTPVRVLCALLEEAVFWPAPF